MFILIFLTLTLVSFVPLFVAGRPNAASEAIRRRLVAVRDGSVSAATGAPLLDLTEAEGRSWTAHVEDLLRRAGITGRAEQLISHAGASLSVLRLLLWTIGVAFAAALLASLFVHLVPLLCVAALAGGWLPWFVLARMRARRLRKFTDGLPGAVDLMARSLRAGHAVNAAVEIVAEQGAQPLAGEFDRVFQQQRFGLRFRDALLEMADRIPSPDLHFVITAILVQRETGGDLPEILDRTAEVIRERVRISGEVRVRTAQGRLTGWILSFLPVALLILINIIDPGYSAMLFHDPTGIKLLYAGAGCICFGCFVISRVVKVEV